MNSANNEGFGYAQLRAHLSYSGFFGETSTKYL